VPLNSFRIFSTQKSRSERNLGKHVFSGSCRVVFRGNGQKRITGSEKEAIIAILYRTGVGDLLCNGVLITAEHGTTTRTIQ